MTTTASTSTIRIFVSHAFKDDALAAAFVRWIELCLHIPAGKTIRCTSASGYKLTIGDDGAAILREDLRASDIVLGLMTDSSLGSAYVLMELGAAWALNKRVGLLVLPPLDFHQIRGPIAALHGVKMDATHDLVDVAETISAATKFKLREAAQLSTATATFVEFVKALPAPTATGKVTRTITDNETAKMLLTDFITAHFDGVYIHSEVDDDLKLEAGMTARLVASACPGDRDVTVTAQGFKLAKDKKGLRG